MSYDDTIAAIATPVGRGGIGIVRLSGPDSLMIADRFFRLRRGGLVESQPSHMARFGRVIDTDSGELVDEAMLLVMRAPNSYTAEDVVEISCHGGPVPLGRTLRLALRAGARLAEPGEFTKRAFLGGRIDLAQAEAVCDLIEARTDASGRLAVQQLAGRLSSEVKAVRELLIAALAEVEASIDFPEHDVEEVTRDRLRSALLNALERVRRLETTAGTGRVFREGVRVAIVGRPNAGKSSLLNALLGQERAIVTEIPGTTRDVIEETSSIEGVPFVLTDTAGIRETTDAVEQLGVARAEEALRLSDLTILVIDGHEGIHADDRRIIAGKGKRRLIIVANKVDLGISSATLDEFERLESDGCQALRVSTLTGEGLVELQARMYALVVEGQVVAGDSAVVTNARHQACLIDAGVRLQRAIEALDQGVPYDLVTIDLRAAVDAVGRITGETVGDDVLEQIFSRFCIGK